MLDLLLAANNDSGISKNTLIIVLIVLAIIALILFIAGRPWRR